METEGKIKVSKKVLENFLSMKSAPATFKSFENHVFDADTREQIKLDSNKEYYILTGKEENLRKMFPQGIPGKECIVM